MGAQLSLIPVTLGTVIPYPLSLIDSVIPKSVSVGVFPTNKSDKVKPSINFPTNAIHIVLSLFSFENNCSHDSGV